MASVPYLRNKAPLPCGPTRPIRLLMTLLAASIVPLIAWLFPLGLPLLNLLGTLPLLMLIGYIVWHAPARCQIQARFDRAYYADILLLTLVLSSILPVFAALLLLVLLHKHLGAILSQPVHGLVPLLARIAFGTQLALANLLQLLLARPTVVPRPRWSLLPVTLPAALDFVPPCLVPRAPPIR